ncbi:Coatomer subunit zeta-2, partial [Zea mays]
PDSVPTSLPSQTCTLPPRSPPPPIQIQGGIGNGHTPWRISPRIILETDANTIAGKVATNAVDGSVPFSEQTISQALATAREHLARSLLK